MYNGFDFPPLEKTVPTTTFTNISLDPLEVYIFLPSGDVEVFFLDGGKQAIYNKKIISFMTTQPEDLRIDTLY